MPNQPLIARRTFFRTAGLVATGAVLAACTRETSKVIRIQTPVVTPEGAVLNPSMALKRLWEGNARFVSGHPIFPNNSTERRVELAGEQKPFATIFGCVDSRVPPEIIFDRGLGDLFVIRTAGNVLDNAALGSIEFGVLEFGTPLIVVLGHSRCGAITAAVDAVEKKITEPGQVKMLVDSIKPAMEAVKKQSGEISDKKVLIEQTLLANLDIVVKKIKASTVVADAINKGKVNVVGVRYDLDKGTVELAAI